MAATKLVEIAVWDRGKKEMVWKAVEVDLTGLENHVWREVDRSPPSVEALEASKRMVAEMLDNELPEENTVWVDGEAR